MSYEVSHDKLYFMVNGKMTLIPQGSKIDPPPAVAARLLAANKIKAADPVVEVPATPAVPAAPEGPGGKNPKKN